MYLYAEVLARVDELHQQRELVAELLIDLLADEQAFVLVDELCQRQSDVDIINQSALDGTAFMSGHAADFPALADIRLSCKYALEGCNLVASPQGGLQIRFKLIWLHILPLT